MKGILKKGEYGWVVVYDEGPKRYLGKPNNFLPVHPDSIPMNDGVLVEFEVVEIEAEVRGDNVWVTKFAKILNDREISDEQIDSAADTAWLNYELPDGSNCETTFKDSWRLAIKWYREQLKQI